MLDEKYASKFPDDPYYVTILVLACVTLLFTWGSIIISFLTKMNKTFLSIISLKLIFNGFIHSVGFTLNWTYTDNNTIKWYYNNESLCQAQSFIIVAASMSLDWWVTIIAYTWYQTIINNRIFDIKKDWKHFLFYVFYCDIIPIIILTVYLLNGFLVKGAINCWLKHEKPGVTQALDFIKWLHLIIAIIITVLIYKNVHSLVKGNQSQISAVNSCLFKMLLYPIVQFFALAIPSTYNFLWYLNLENPAKYLSMIMLIFSACQGIIYPICYIYSYNLIGLMIAIYKNKNKDYQLREINQIINEVGEISWIQEKSYIEDD